MFLYKYEHPRNSICNMFLYLQTFPDISHYALMKIFIRCYFGIVTYSKVVKKRNKNVIIIYNSNICENFNQYKIV